MLKISICPLDVLKPHELIVENLLNSLIKKIIESKVIYDPLIVDENSLVVLDGMHRLEALKRMRIKFVPVCLVDYKNENIFLKRWFRIVKNPPRKDTIAKELRSKGFEVREVEFNEANEIISRRKAYFALHWKDYSLIVKEPNQPISIVRASRKLYEVESILRNYGAEIEYKTEKEAMKSFIKSNDCIMVTTISLSKEEVIATALKGDLLAPKSTRHIVPVRPLSVNIPLEILSYSMSPQGILNWLADFLNSREAILLKGGAVVRGRRYEEDVLLFR